MNGAPEKQTTIPHFPTVSVTLTGTDGNAYSVIGLAAKAMRLAGVSVDDRDAFVDEATSGDYDNVLATAMRWVEVN